MALKKYNAISKYPGSVAKHRGISNPVKFMQYMQSHFSVTVIFFYDYKSRAYEGYWKPGKPYHIH